MTTRKTTTPTTPESQNVEWKSSWRDEHLKWICGFANAQGGVLGIGRNDCGEVVGVRGARQLLAEIPDKVQSLLGIVVDVDVDSEGGRDCLQIVVRPHPNPISYRGEIHYRSGGTRQVLSGAALSRFLMERHGRTWDDVPLPGVDLEALDDRVLAGFRNRGVASERLAPEILSESDESVIEKLQLGEAGFLKRAAVLLFHPEPHRFIMEAFVKIGFFRGSELFFQDVVEGDLFTQVDRTMDLLYTKYRRALISYDGVHRVETFPVPREAMREAVVNAIVHRDYASPATIQIRVSDNRISIWNPARLSPDWAAEQLAEEHSSRPHNPRVAQVFFRAGMIEAWGRGLRRIVDLCHDVGNPTPTWTLEACGGGVWVRFPFSEGYQVADAAARGCADPGTTQNPTQNTTQIHQNTAQISQKTTRDQILDYLRAEPELTRRELAVRVGVTPDGVKYHLRRLKAAGVLRRVGSDRSGYWEVVG